MKKVFSVILAFVMLLSIGSVASYAADTHKVVFEECPYDISSFRSDYPGKYMGYHYGIDYWFTITNQDGTTTDIKGFPYSVEVPYGKSLEIKVNVADYIEPSSVRMLAYPTGTQTTDLYNPITGESHDKYQLAKSSANTFGIVPQEDLSICVSEIHLYNDCFKYTFPNADYYKTQRLQYISTAVNPEDMYVPFEDYDLNNENQKVIYLNETVFFEVRLPLDDTAHEYHYDTYQVYYTNGYGSDATTTYLKKPASEKEGTEAVDLRVAHYETETEWVDVYAIPNVKLDLQVKVANTVTYTLDMLKQFFDDFSLENIDNLDLSTIDFGPMVEFIVKLLTLIVNLLKGFGLEIDISSLLG